MRFRQPETDLERDLRAQRPQPREQFVQMLSRQHAAPRVVRRRRAPALVLVAAVTAVLAASLGAAGALGNASHSVSAFYKSASHIVQSPKAPSTFNGNNKGTSGNKGGSGNGNNGNNGNENGNDNDNDNDGHGNNSGDPGGGFFHPPFQHEYDHLVPVCFNKRFTLFVFSKEAFFLVTFDSRQFTLGACRRV